MGRSHRAPAPPRPPPASSYALLQRGLVLLLCERFEAAEEDLSLALELHPGWPRAHYLRGFVHKARGQFDAAATDFHAASSEVRVDYLHVYHVSLAPDAILEEAGWHPLPSIYNMTANEDEPGEEFPLGQVAEGSPLLRQVAALLLHRLENVRA